MSVGSRNDVRWRWNGRGLLNMGGKIKLGIGIISGGGIKNSMV